ncbi:polysaccharide biosynthesis tyrosine autokinase [Luteimicrobium subarcticum]|uniref:non-specific protein-tyrosine kinase n=1 Tax=Luteimicrobium subarcticum TaxID=620910 RepID=A0A2M8WUW5_9MICO|nr:polysaccharide biosynthesis tyrosine autokinase [Luteimicrobium subarcticum]PJI94725.1 capsular exopolysaccharide synthesis family protein [Luteimicrobium subarcticum]
MELQDFVATLRKRWLTVVVCTLAGGLLAFTLAAFQTPMYTASTQLYVSVQGDSSAGALVQGANYSQQQVTSYVQLVSSPKVLAPVIDDLGLDMSAAALADHVSATSPKSTSLIVVQVEDPSASTAALVANATAEQLREEISALETPTDGGASKVKVTVVREADPPMSPSSPNIRVDATLGVLLGLVVGVGWVMLRRALDTGVRDVEAVSQVTDVPVIGGIAFDKQAAAHPLVLESSPHSPRAEAFRRLRTNLQFIDVGGGPRTVVVTSSLPGEGKSTTALNLAITLAAAGTRVALVDADLRRPTIATYSGLEGAVGLTTVLIGQADLDDALQPWGNANLRVLAAGQVPPNPSELLGSQAMSDLLQELARRHEMVILDAPPILPVTDAAVLARMAGGAIVVAGAGITRKHQLRDALGALDAVGARALGIVLNRRKASEDSHYYGGYGYATEDANGRKGAAAPPPRSSRPVPRPPTPQEPGAAPDGGDDDLEDGTWPGQTLTESRIDEMRTRHAARAAERGAD